MSAVIDDHGHADHAHGPAKGLMRWVLTTNHKDIGTLYLWFSFIMFMLGALVCVVIRAELLQPGLQIVEAGNLQPDDHHACAGDGLRRGDAGFRRPRQLDDSADDRRAGHGAATDEQLVSFWLLPAAFSCCWYRPVHCCPVADPPAAGRSTPPLSTARAGQASPSFFAIHDGVSVRSWARST
jgi:hypothetical protein